MRNLSKILVFLNLIIFGGIVFGQELPTHSTSNDEREYANQLNPYSKLIKITRENNIKLALGAEEYLLNGDRSSLIVSPEYYTKFSSFLKDKQTGLARLYPERNCHTGVVVSIEKAEDCADALPIIGNGSYYSFRIKTNLKNAKTEQVAFQTVEFNDIHYVDGEFRAGGEKILGIITELKNTDLQNFDKKSGQIRFLQDYKIEKHFSKVTKQKELLKQGFEYEGFQYSDRVSANLGSTYLLRSVAYDFDRLLPRGTISRASSMEFRADIIVSFQVVGQEKDGSIVILWKQFESKSPPTLLPNK